ncbi:MAG TPA: YCF48-related protein [Bacteroidales bacterium]|nr:YCF48-related protein [Bacteroidales bacterium]
MKAIALPIRFVLILIFVTLVFSGCEKEPFYSEYAGIYGTWTIRNISGGFSGAGFEPDFDILVITSRMQFSIYRNDTLLADGKIEIIEQTSDNLRVLFKSKDDFGHMFTGLEKEIRLGNDTLILNDGCCDMYSYFFVRSEVYADEKYIQVDKTFDILDVATYNTGFNRYYTSLFFQNEELGFITCYEGSILKTSDGGRTWNEVETNNTMPLYDISFIDSNTGFAVGGISSCGGTGCTVPGYLMLKTTDGGETWGKVYLPYSPSEFRLIKFINEDTGFAFGNGVRLKTSDGGMTWTGFSIEGIKYVYDLFFLDDNTGFLTGIQGQLLKTSDGGETWQDMSLETNDQLYTVMFLNEQTGYIGNGNSLIKTTDGGLSWSTEENSPSGVVKMNFTSETNGVVFGTRTYASSKWDVWDSKINLLIDGKWYGDNRVKFHGTPFILDPKHFFTINGNEEISVIKVTN